MHRRRDVWGLSVGVLILMALCSCSAQDGKGNGGKGDTAKSTARYSIPKRIMLVGVQALDSARAAAPAVVDEMLTQIFDSIPETEYIPMARRSEVAGEAADSAISVTKLASAFKLDGVISIRVARFGSLVGIDMAVFEPTGGKEIFHDRLFSFIRYRDQEGIKLLGPALYEALERGVHRLMRRADADRLVVSAEPIIVSSVVIARDTTLGEILTNREKISTDGIRALGDFMRLKYPELIVLDYESRTRVYETVGVKMVEDHEPVGDLERNAMFNLDLPYYLTTGIYPASNDSVEIRAEVRYVLSPRSDESVFSESRRYPRMQFETSMSVKSAVTELLEVADEVLGKHADRVRETYRSSITPGR